MWRAMHFDRGSLRVLERTEEVVQAVASGRGALWLDLQDPTPEEVELLNAFRLDPLAIEDIVAEIHHPKVDDYGDYLYLAVHGVWPGRMRGEMATCELDIVLADHWLITHGPVTMRTVPEIWAKCVKAGTLPGGSTVETLQAILATQSSHHVDEVERLQAELAKIEPELLEPGPRLSTPHRKIYQIKADLARLRIILGSQREVVHRLSRGDFKAIPARLHMHFRDVYDDLYRAAEMTDVLRDIANSALETYLNVAANRTNDIVKVLTIISSIILPMTLISGWFGMNFKHMSEFDWLYGQWFAFGLCAMVTVMMLFFFRRKRWL